MGFFKDKRKDIQSHKELDKQLKADSKLLHSVVDRLEDMTPLDMMAEMEKYLDSFPTEVLMMLWNNTLKILESRNAFPK